MKQHVILSDTELTNFSNQKNSLTSTVYEALIKRFVNGNLVPGDMLNRRAIAKDLGVSVAPVLEALIQLELEGFVESIPRKGTIIKPIKPWDIYSQLLIREALETVALKFYHGSALRENFNELMEYAAAMDDRNKNMNTRNLEYIHEEINFHASLVNLCKMPVLTREYIKSIRVGVFTNINRLGDMHTSKQSHIELLEHLITDDFEEAKKAIISHIWSGKPDFSYFGKNYEEKNEWIRN
jgi:DNA-binding GntR family transcriptional regulator